MTFRSAHHTVFPRAEWSLRPDGKAIREHPSLIKRMTWEQHQDIHKNVPGVPLLGFHALFRTLKEFKPADTTTESLENLMRAMEVAAVHPKSHQIETQLALLAIDAIDLQRPFIANIEEAERRSYL